MCYHHDGDGVCESFERTYSIQDCGFYTPDDYEDQWASDITVSTQLQSDDCPAFVILGPPAVYHVCIRIENPVSVLFQIGISFFIVSRTFKW